MLRIAVRTLLHDRPRFLGSVLGVAAAGTLVLVQIGLHRGFLRTCSQFIERAGGDIWFMARGTEVFDNGEALPGGTASRAASHPCVARVRSLVADYAQVRTAAGTLVTVQVLGFDVWEATRSTPMPWTLAQGLRDDLRGPYRVGVDVLDAEKLGIASDPIGRTLDVGGKAVTVAIATRGIRPFTLTPYVFADLGLARELVGLKHDQSTYFLADLTDASCAPIVASAYRDDPQLQVLSQASFIEKTQAFWISGSGIGAVLGFGSMLALAVGSVVLGQTLHTLTRLNLKELAALKAVGATGFELVAFVAWQALSLAALGGALAWLVALGLRAALSSYGLEVVLSSGVLGIGLLAIFVMCAFASVFAARTVLRMSVTEVLK